VSLFDKIRRLAGRPSVDAPPAPVRSQAAAPPPPTGGAQGTERKPLFSSIVFCNRASDLTLTRLAAALHDIAPSSVLGDWSGPFKEPPADALGTGMLSIDGVSLSALAIAAPVPRQEFDRDLIPSRFPPDVAERLRNHRAHVMVVAPRKPVGRAASIATARAATLLTSAIARVTGAEVFKWADSRNVLPASLLRDGASALLPAGGKAVPAWVRLFIEQDSHGKTVVGTYGLWAFGLPEIEYAPTDLPVGYLGPHAWGVCGYLLASDKPINNGENIAVEGGDPFRIETLERGRFVALPTLRLTRLDAREQDAKGITLDPSLRSG
jgi:uncharacterized protein DUF4261